MSTVLISGARGFIAGCLAKSLREAGFHVLGLSRNAGPLPYFHEVFSGFLLNPIQRVFERDHVDVFIHCAYHVGEDELEINVNGTRLWSEQAQRNGVRRQIFFTSISAAVPVERQSLYGKAKHELEEWFVRHNERILRLGLVTGPGGLFQRMVDLVRNQRVVPLPDGGRAEMYLTEMDWLSGFIRDVVAEKRELKPGRVWNMFQPEKRSLSALLREIKKQTNSRCLFLPVPSCLLLTAVIAAEKLPFLKFQVNRNNLIGLRRNSGLTLESDFELFGVPPKSLPEMLDFCK